MKKGKAGAGDGSEKTVILGPETELAKILSTPEG